jgi:hypothetical protein
MDANAVEESTDIAVVRGLYQRFMDAGNRSSATGLAAVFAEDGDLVACRCSLKSRASQIQHAWASGDVWSKPGGSKID